MPTQKPPELPYPMAKPGNRVDLAGPASQCWMNVTAALHGKGAPLTPAEERRIFSGHPWYTVVDLPSRLEGGLLGLLTGDAMGVPYEFHGPEALPRLDHIQLDPPQGFPRAHRRAPRGAWSDDGAQALCLLESLLDQGRLDLDDFAARLVRWHRDGHMAVEGVVFDVGIQTAEVLRKMAAGASWHEVVPTDDEQANGNGSLMRVLPLALWHVGSDLDLVADARRSSSVTHGHLRSQLCCALYCLWARRLFFGSENAYEEATDTLYRLVAEEPAAVRELNDHIRPREALQPFGKGYVVDTLHTVRAAMQAECFERVVQTAISFGNDTDTTAALAGGLAGLREGVDAIPESWRLHDGGMKVVRPLMDRLLEWRRMGRTTGQR